MKEMIKCSCKYSCAIFNMYKSTGPVIVYMNYIVLEGIHVFKIYLKYFGFRNYLDKKSTDFHRYAEFTGEVNSEQKREANRVEQLEENKHGKIIREFGLAPKGKSYILLNPIKFTIKDGF